MKIIGLDVGEKRIGVAKADTTTKIAVPVGFVMVDDRVWDELKKIAALNNTKFICLFCDMNYAKYYKHISCC